jgi:hypothetical protein
MQDSIEVMEEKIEHQASARKKAIYSPKQAGAIEQRV